MWNKWSSANFSPNGDFPIIFPVNPDLAYLFASRSWSHVNLFVDNTVNNSIHITGSTSFEGAFSCIPKIAGALFCWISKGPNNHLLSDKACHSLPSRPQNCHSSLETNATSLKGDTSRCHKNKSSQPVGLSFFDISSLIAKKLWNRIELSKSLPFLSLVAAVVPPFDNSSSKMLAFSINGIAEESPMQELGCCDGHNQGCSSFPLSSRNCGGTNDTVEPSTGIKFPTIIGRVQTDGNNFNKIPEVLVGTGSRTMKVVKVKSLRIYAFGLYVDPASICKKLGWKYSSLPTNELTYQEGVLRDLLREDIDMTVRLVVNCRGLRINAVRDAFEKSIRTRLSKINSEADTDCLRVFGSYFSQDIQLPVGTTIDFKRTADGQLITEIGGKFIGAVQSKDFCKAFFDMYIGDGPVSPQTKQEIGENVAYLIKRC